MFQRFLGTHRLSQWAGGLTSFFVGSSLFLSQSLFAATVQQRNVEQLTEASNHVYRVRVLEQRSMEHNGFPFTEIHSQVLETFKGEAPEMEKVSFHLPGGLKPGSSQRVLMSGVPGFESGGEYIVFLSEAPGAKSINRLEAWEAFIVSVDKGTGQRFVIRMREDRDAGEAFQRTRQQRQNIHSLSADSSSLRIRPYEDVVTEIFSTH